MSTETVHARWIEDQTFLLSDRHGFPIVAAQPNGARPADLLPLSLISCAAWDVIAIARKQRQQVTSFRITAESERDEDPPWRFRRIRVRYTFSGHNLDADKLQRAIELAESKYCSIYATLRAAVEITSELEISDD